MSWSLIELHASSYWGCPTDLGALCQYLMASQVNAYRSRSTLHLWLTFIISNAECHTGDSAVSNCRRAQQPYAHHLQFARRSFQGFKEWPFVVRPF